MRKGIRNLLMLFLNFFKVSVFWLAGAINFEEYQVDLDLSDLRVFTKDEESKGLVF